MSSDQYARGYTGTSSGKAGESTLEDKYERRKGADQDTKQKAQDRRRNKGRNENDDEDEDEDEGSDRDKRKGGYVSPTLGNHTFKIPMLTP